jgi:putative ATPase
MPRKRTPPAEESLFAGTRTVQPLAARMRPRSLDEFLGQEHLLAPGKPLRQAVESGAVTSMILWGPPGSGKTTLGRIMAERGERAFVPFSAVAEGVPRIRAIAQEAAERLAAGGPATILFIDEIHRLNKAQQDSLLPHVEEGTFTLVGATTEAPSFEINSALLSRARVFVLEPLAAEHVATLLERAMQDAERGVGGSGLTLDAEALALVARMADGDARRALNALEAAAGHVGPGGRITEDVARDALQLRLGRYDRGGEEHYNLLSAYHKSLRGSDPDAALYWAARMIEAGEDPMTLFRRAIAMAAEDIGLADPQALQLAIAARDAYHMLGEPEGYLPLAELTIYLATAPKSNRSYAALNAAREAARNSPAAPVPLHIRNAPTKLHRELGYHAGYRYAHEAPEGYTPQEYLPEELRGSTFYTPGPFGFEKEIARRLRWWAGLRERGGGEDGESEENDGSDG